MGTDDDGMTMEALMASASRNVPLPDTLQHGMQGETVSCFFRPS